MPWTTTPPPSMGILMSSTKHDCGGAQGDVNALRLLQPCQPHVCCQLSGSAGSMVCVGCF